MVLLLIHDGSVKVIIWDPPKSWCFFPDEVTGGGSVSHIQTMELAEESEERRLKLLGKWENAIDIRLKWSEAYTCM